jgi:hypothetical protein
MADALLTIALSPVGTPTEMQVTWTYDGTPQAVQTIPAVAGQTVYPYPFSANNPDIELVNGDTVAASVLEFDSVNNLTGPASTIGPITIVETPPPVAPGAPMLTLVQTS